MRDFGLVLHTHLRVLWKRVTLKRWKGVLGLIPALVIVGGVGLLLGIGAFRLFVYLGGALHGQPEILKALDLNILAGYGLVVAAMVLVNAFGSVYAAI